MLLINEDGSFDTIITIPKPLIFTDFHVDSGYRALIISAPSIDRYMNYESKGERNLEKDFTLEMVNSIANDSNYHNISKYRYSGLRKEEPIHKIITILNTDIIDAETFEELRKMVIRSLGQSWYSLSSPIYNLIKMEPW